MNDNLRITLLKMLSEDGISEDRQLSYTAIMARCENESFINGRRFEKDGKEGALPPACHGLDIRSEHDSYLLTEYTREQEENIKRWSD